MCISPPSAWIASSLTGRAAASISTGKAAISIGVAWPARSSGATEAGSSNRQASALVEQLREIGTARLGPEVEHQRALGRIEELEQRASAVRQQRRRAAHRIATRRLDLEHIGAEVGRDLAGERRRQPQAKRHAGVVHLDDGEALQAAGQPWSSRDDRRKAWLRSTCARVLRSNVTEGLHGTDRQSQGADVRHFPRPVPPGRREPDAWPWRATWS